MRLVICDGIQYDADKLPANVDASRCVPADEWFAQNRRTGAAAEPDSTEQKRDVESAPKRRRRSSKS